MKKLTIFLVIGAFASTLFAQGEFPDSPYDKPHVSNRKPIDLQHIRYADVMWSKKLERTLPLREKKNHVLYFPDNREGRIGSRFSFTALTINGVRQGYFQAYDPMSEGAVPISEEDFESRLGKETETVEVYNEDDGTYDERVIENEVNPSEIKFLILREEWIFDKARSTMDPRIMWIKFVREYQAGDPSDLASLEIRKSLPFKIYYPVAEPLYARNEVFNPHTDGDQKTFYDIFMFRFFNSFISMETNTHNNREVNSYMLGIEQLYEAQDIKNFIFRFEHDLWEF
ncbi:MAG: gliding motility protein GldN [Bacteroidales bacterium]